MVQDGLVRMQRCRAGRVGVMVDDTFSELFGDTSVAALLGAGSVALGGAVLHIRQQLRRACCPCVFVDEKTLQTVVLRPLMKCGERARVKKRKG